MTENRSRGDMLELESNLVDEAMSKLTAALRFLQKFKENGAPNKSSSNSSGVHRKSGRKRKRPVIKNMCRNVIDFLDSNFPDGSLQTGTTARRNNKKDRLTDAKHKITKSNGAEERHSCDTLDTRTIETEAKYGNLDFMENQNNESQNKAHQCKLKRHKHQILGVNVPRRNLLRAALNAKVSDFSWCALVCGHQENNLEMMANLADFDIDERETILSKFILAKSLWTCKKCQSFDSIERMLSGYIACNLCQHWFHRVCCSDNNGRVEDSFNFRGVGEFVCESCASQFFGGEENDERSIVATGGAVQFQTVPVEESGEAPKLNLEENCDTKLVSGQTIELMQQSQVIPVLDSKDQTANQPQFISPEAGTQIYYQLPPNVTFPSGSEGQFKNLINIS